MTTKKDTALDALLSTLTGADTGTEQGSEIMPVDVAALTAAVPEPLIPAASSDLLQAREQEALARLAQVEAKEHELQVREAKVNRVLAEMAHGRPHISAPTRPGQLPVLVVDDTSGLCLPFNDAHPANLLLLSQVKGVSFVYDKDEALALLEYNTARIKEHRFSETSKGVPMPAPRYKAPDVEFDTPVKLQAAFAASAI
jgi:hypothetical protein